MDKIRVASAQYRIQPITSWQIFAAQTAAVVRTAADYGARLVVLPEYFTAQLLSLGDARRPIREAVHGLADFVEPFQEHFAALARKHKIHIAAGTLPTRAGNRVFNDAYLFDPRGKVATQGKLHMTRFEAESWKISPRDELRVFDTDLGRLAIAICYDVEFPEIVRAAAKKGAQLLIVPSCTDNRQGWLRVRYCAHARAIENQLYVIQSSTVGGLPEIPAIHLNYGISSILTPSDYAGARDGILAEGVANEDTIVIGDLSLKALDRMRKDGSVLTLRDSARSEKLAQSAKSIRFK